MTQAAIDSSALLNGLPLAGLEETVRVLEENPQAGLLRFETVTRWLGGTRCRSEVSGYVMGGQRIERKHLIESDEPLEIFGRDEAPNPQELLFSAIGSCVSVVWAVKAAAAGVRLRALEVEVRGTLDMRGPMEIADVPPGFPEVECIVHVDADAPLEQLEELHRTVQATSPNFYHLTSAIPARAQLVVR